MTHDSMRLSPTALLQTVIDARDGGSTKFDCTPAGGGSNGWFCSLIVAEI
jgi:hypothetical protein